MSTANKITFGNKSANLNTKNTYGFTSGENITPSYAAYQPLSGNVGTTAYQPYSEATTGTQQIRFGQNAGTYNTNFQQIPAYQTRASNIYVETGNSPRYTPPTEIRSPVNTNVVFGNKNYTDTYTPAANYTRTNYVAPAVQTYQTYSKPVEITTLTSQPIREETRVETRYEQPQVQVRRSQTRVESPVVTSPVVTAEKPKLKKGGCPAWLWPLLGVLALLALILGLLFGLGVFRGGEKGAAVPNGFNGTIATNTVTNQTTSGTGSGTSTSTNTGSGTGSGTSTGSNTTTTITTTTTNTTRPIEEVTFIDPVAVKNVSTKNSTTAYTTYPTSTSTITTSSNTSGKTYTTYPSNSNTNLNVNSAF